MLRNLIDSIRLLKVFDGIETRCLPIPDARSTNKKAIKQNVILAIMFLTEWEKSENDIDDYIGHIRQSHSTYCEKDVSLVFR